MSADAKSDELRCGLSNLSHTLEKDANRKMFLRSKMFFSSSLRERNIEKRWAWILWNLFPNTGANALTQFRNSDNHLYIIIILKICIPLPHIAL